MKHTHTGRHLTASLRWSLQELIFSGEFANNLPDFQKIEILMFVMGKMPMPGDAITPVK